MRIEIYLDGEAEPFEIIEAPETFKLDTTKLDDGRHKLRFKAIADDGSFSVRETRFDVRNGPGIAVHGIRDGDLVSGEITVLANAYSSKVGDVFEPMRIETPAPIPTWAWLIFLFVFAWGMWYLGIEYKEQQTLVAATVAGPSIAADSRGNDADKAGSAVAPQSWTTLGKQVYENNCASCHQVAGQGLPGLFPSLIGNSVVNATDATEHVEVIANGLQGKMIDGIAYPAPMPPFGALLSDEEIAAVVNHERTNWGNSAITITAEQVGAMRD